MDRSEQDEEAESWPPGSSPSRRASRGRDSPSTSPSGCQFDCSISDVQPDFTCHNFRHNGHRKPVHQSLHNRWKKKQCKGNFWRRGSEVEALSMRSSLQYGLVRQWCRTAQHQEVDLEVWVQLWQITSLPFSSMSCSQSTSSSFTAHQQQLSCLFGKKLPSRQTLSLFVSLSTLAPGMCAQSRKCQTGVGLLDVWLPAPHTKSFTAPLLLCQPDWIVHVQTHTFIRSSLSNTSPVTRSPFTGPG